MHSKTPQHVQYAMMLDLALPLKHQTFDEKRAAMPMRIMWLLLQRANYCLNKFAKYQILTFTNSND
jgi:hypothetical protein